MRTEASGNRLVVSSSNRLISLEISSCAYRMACKLHIMLYYAYMFLRMRSMWYRLQLVANNRAGSVFVSTFCMHHASIVFANCFRRALGYSDGHERSRPEAVSAREITVIISPTYHKRV